MDRRHRSLEVPAGLPLGDVEIRLVDADGNPDPVRGEMVIRSRHNALGYLNQVDEQSHVFTTDTQDPSRTWYRTGDLARRRPDGRYVVLGRVDAQVKVRGHRIEPSEVESALRKHADILDVGVHAPEGPDGERVLVACYIPRPGASVDRRDLAAWCADLLPRYLVPTEWIQVDHLPRTPSGKVDRRALPTPDLSASNAGGTGALESQEEELLAGIWSAVLGREGIGREDDFFELGGHSLRAVEVVARVRDAFGIDLPLRTFFEIILPLSKPGVVATAVYVLIVAIGLSDWVQYARTVRGATMVQKSREYVQAAQLIGRSPLAIMFRHVLPNVTEPILVIATISLALAIIAEATLSFLGVGVPPTQPSLGTLIRFGQAFLFSGEWWILLFPSLTLLALALSVNLLGDWLREALNPRLR